MSGKRLFSEKFKPFFEMLDPVQAKKHEKIRYVLIYGGRGGAKSYALSAWVNTASFLPGWGILYTRYTMTSAETSIIPEYRKMCQTLGNEACFDFKRTRVINGKSGVIIDYKGLKPSSLQSTGALKSVAGKNVFILEEAEDCPDYELFAKVNLSIRTKEHKNLTVMVFNQSHQAHWIYEQFFKAQRDDVMMIPVTYLDNARFLSDDFLREAEREKERNFARYQHIYLTEWQSDIAGALWVMADIEPHRITFDELKKRAAGGRMRTVIGYDPAVTDTSKPGLAQIGKQPDEDGIVICAKDTAGEFYVVRDYTCRGSRADIAQKLVSLYHRYDAESIVIEKNNGGDFIPALIQTATDGKYVRCKTVTATKGKQVRAQPIQAKYEKGEVHHVGYLSELEYELTSWMPGSNMSSPNRMDALVWALTELGGAAAGSRMILAS